MSRSRALSGCRRRIAAEHSGKKEIGPDAAFFASYLLRSLQWTLAYRAAAGEWALGGDVAIRHRRGGSTVGIALSNYAPETNRQTQPRADASAV
jgi:hypothetical protein